MRFSSDAGRFLIFCSTVQMAFTVVNLTIACIRFGETPAVTPFWFALAPSLAMLVVTLSADEL